VDYESFSAICPANKGNAPLIGQVQHTSGDRSARLMYLMPTPVEDAPGLAGLIEFLCIHAGKMGAVNLLAEVKDSDPLLEEMRKNSFSIYGWESIWQLPSKTTENFEKFSENWQRMTPAEEPLLRSLYQTLVPPLVQSSEVFSGADLPRLVYRNTSGEIVAYVESISGLKGIYLKPVVHPSIENIEDLLKGLISLFQGLGKPVYLQMRSYQAWITPALEKLGALTTVHFALLVRHLAIAQYASANPRILTLENRHVEPTAAPMVNKISENNQVQK
jgi:hypothetical protein